jgi:hypothetical protein
MQWTGVPALSIHDRYPTHAGEPSDDSKVSSQAKRVTGSVTRPHDAGCGDYMTRVPGVAIRWFAQATGHCSPMDYLLCTRTPLN